MIPLSQITTNNDILSDEKRNTTDIAAFAFSGKAAEISLLNKLMKPVKAEADEEKTVEAEGTENETQHEEAKAQEAFYNLKYTGSFFMAFFGKRSCRSWLPFSRND